MATYTELRQLYNLDALRNRIEVALAVKVNGVLADAEPSSAKMEWARSMLTGSYHAAEGLLKLMLAANKQLTSEQILFGVPTRRCRRGWTAIESFMRKVKHERRFMGCHDRVSRHTVSPADGVLKIFANAATAISPTDVRTEQT